ncbi:DUF4339 domain-containing protein [Stieleria marina]|uniref:GYF domain-containing protein n=1 Tax=Stieleria marina TaxID=1930275 RepID=A0A517P135_9BACT|nr:hypothetical protein K239x_51120 [Planctomycetes bacterium K23_9]
MADWFVKPEDSDAPEAVVGPLKPNELLDLVRSGDVVPETQIRKGDSAWFSASSVGGLFEAAIRPTITCYCPNCNAAISTPPTVCAKCLTSVQKAREEIVENTIHVRGNDVASNAGRSVQNWLKKKVRNKDKEQ